jgi:hypothetical protein
MNAIIRCASLSLLVAISSCGGSHSRADAPSSRGAESAPAQQGRDTKDLEGAPVYDAKGKQKPCELPVPTCPEPARDRDFLDKCTLAGFQVRRCGCELVCSGNVVAEKSHYDARGKPKRCEPERKDCTPPDTSARFQDACNDAGHQLVVCGCEWLCTGPLKDSGGGGD